MKQFWRNVLIKLYPASWQQRYGAEYLVLLETMPLTLRGTVDILVGALDAHLHPEWVEYGRFPMNNQKRGLRIAGNGAILSALLLVLGMLNNGRMSESATEFLLLLAPITLLPLVVVLHRFYRPFRPRASLITAVLGITSMTTFLIASFLGLTSQSIGFDLQPLSFAWVFQLFIAGIGVWIILAAFLGQQTHTLPNGLPAMMGTSGFGWTVMFIGVMLASQGNSQLLLRFSSIMGAGFALWLMTHFIWTIWFGLWAWQQTGFDAFDQRLTSS